MSETITFNGRTIELSNTNKLYFPQEGVTKGDLIDYYRRIADTILPHIRQRPLTMHRFPNGIEETGFYQKEAPDYFPDWIDRVNVPVESEEEDQTQIVCNEAATLVYLANQGCITPHVWLSRVDSLNYPDRLIFDLDPPDSDFGLVRAAARMLRAALEEAGLVPFLMTTGSRGLHVTAPLDGRSDFDTVRTFARTTADRLAEQEPDKFTTETRKAAPAAVSSSTICVTPLPRPPSPPMLSGPNRVPQSPPRLIGMNWTVPAWTPNATTLPTSFSV